MTYIFPWVTDCRGGKFVYRIVGFEVDPRSVSINSILLKTDKETPIKDNNAPVGSKCTLPQEVNVEELHKGSM